MLDQNQIHELRVSLVNFKTELTLSETERGLVEDVISQIRELDKQLARLTPSRWQ